MLIATIKRYLRPPKKEEQVSFRSVARGLKEGFVLSFGDKIISFVVILFAFTILLIGILLFSVAASANMVAAQAPGDPFIQVTQILVDQFNETSNEAESSLWVFGPQPEIYVQYLDNDTDISQNNFRVEAGTELLVNVTIPHEFLGAGVGLEIVKFWGSAGEGPGLA